MAQAGLPSCNTRTKEVSRASCPSEGPVHPTAKLGTKCMPCKCSARTPWVEPRFSRGQNELKKKHPYDTQMSLGYAQGTSPERVAALHMGQRPGKANMELAGSRQLSTESRGTWRLAWPEGNVPLHLHKLYEAGKGPVLTLPQLPPLPSADCHP